jgi:hypothetical protein
MENRTTIDKGLQFLRVALASYIAREYIFVLVRSNVPVIW